MAVIQGLEAFEDKLNRLSLTVQRKVLVKCLKEEAGEIIRQGAQDAAPVLSGELSENEIISLVASETNAYYALIRIGPNRTHFYGTFEEHGTAHQPEEPWLGPSFKVTKVQAEARMAAAFKEAVESI